MLLLDEMKKKDSAEGYQGRDMWRDTWNITKLWSRDIFLLLFPEWTQGEQEWLYRGWEKDTVQLI